MTRRLIAALALAAPPLLAETTPLATALEASGEPVYGGLGQAEHVYGYRFKATAPGRVSALGGRFSGTKDVVLLDASRTALASARVAGGDGATWRWRDLGTPVPLVPGTEYTVAVRAGSAATMSAAWRVPAPFDADGLRVLGAVQGWSPSGAVDDWAATLAPLAEPLARGLVDVRFAATGTGDGAGGDDSGDGSAGGGGTPGGGTDGGIGGGSDDGGGTGGGSDGVDPHAGTPGVIDSFGDADPSGELGPGFAAVAVYYRDFPRRPGECSREVHDRWWVRDENGVTHPTWHPPVDPESGCAFAHEHGSDPRLSPNYAFAGGVPFGLVHGDHAAGHRHEDHVGHKVVVRNGYGTVVGNPQNGSAPGTEPITRTGVACDWLSKIHQGSWSRDALGNNAHEYYLNLRCDDGLALRLRYLLTYGPPELVTNICSTGTDERFPTGVAGPMGVPVVDALDGKREFACVGDRLYADSLAELWKGDGSIDLPGGGYIRYSPYYAVLNPARYVDDRWRERGAPDAYVSSLDFCFPDTDAWRGQAPGFCAGVPADFASMSPAARQRAPRNPMNGTRRVLHPKEMIVVADAETGGGADYRFCTDRLGRAARDLADGERCADGEIEQLVSRVRRADYDRKGSDVNAIVVDGQLRGAGFLAEWPLDFDHPTIRFPN